MNEILHIQSARRSGKAFGARRALLAKVHIAKSQLCLEDDSYRAMLHRLTGKESSADLTIDQLELVLKEFGRLGFKPKQKRTSKDSLPSDAQASKIRALWLTLYNLGEVRDPAEEALIAYCKRMGGVAAVQWMHSPNFDAVIKGLYGWLERTPWQKPDAALIRDIKRARRSRGIDADPDSVSYSGIAAKAETVRAQYRMLGRSFKGLHPEMMQAHELDALMVELGYQCREIKAESKDA